MARTDALNSAKPSGQICETRDQKRGRIFSGLIRAVDQAVGQVEGDEEMRGVLMKLFLDLMKRKKALVSITEEES